MTTRDEAAGGTGEHVVHTLVSVGERQGGPARNVIRLSEEVAALGGRTSVLAFELSGRWGPSLGSRAPSVDISEVAPLLRPLGPLFSGHRFVRELRRRLQGGRGVVHDHGIWLPFHRAVRTEARRSGWPLVVSPRGMLEPWALRYRALRKRLAWHLFQRRILHDADLLHATNEREASSLRRLGLQGPLALIPNGVAESPLVASAETLTHPRTALFLSRVHPVKGVDLLVDAWARLGPTGWRLVIAGPDEVGLVRDLVGRLGQAGVAGSVSFPGAVEDRQKWDLYASASLFVLPSRSESFGSVVGEALSAGVPVLTTDATPWSWLEAEGCGWSVAAAVEPLAAALQEALALSDERRLEMGRRGRALVSDRFGWPGVAQRMLAAYTWVREGGEPPPDILAPGGQPA